MKVKLARDDLNLIPTPNQIAPHREVAVFVIPQAVDGPALTRLGEQQQHTDPYIAASLRSMT